MVFLGGTVTETVREYINNEYSVEFVFGSLHQLRHLKVNFYRGSVYRKVMSKTDNFPENEAIVLMVDTIRKVENAR